MSYTGTANLDLKKADIGSNQAFETSVMNSNWDKIDTKAGTLDTRVDDVETASAAATSAVTAIDGRVTTLEGKVPASRSVSGTSYSLLSTDADDFLYTTSSSAVTFTVANVLSAGQYVNVIQQGSGQVSFVAGSGVTLNSVSSNKKISAQHGAVSIICVASGVYQLVGSLSA